jgi:hypothetical protein
VRGRVEALLTARAAAHLASLQVENDTRKYFTGRVCAAAYKRCSQCARRQVGMTHENILRGERARPRRSVAQGAWRRSLGLFAGRNDARNILSGERARPRSSIAHGARCRPLGFFAGRNGTRKYFTSVLSIQYLFCHIVVVYESEIRVSDPDPYRIRIQSGQWIPIQEGKNYPQDKKNFLKFHVLKC